MLKIGDRVIVTCDDGGHFYKGKHGIVEGIVKTSAKPYYIKAAYGQTYSWYAEKDLVIDETELQKDLCN